MARRLSAADKRILAVLQADGRISNVDLAQRVGMSPSPCLRRVKALEAEGIIERYIALVDRKSVGLDIEVFVQISLDRHNDAVVARFRQAVEAMPEVISCRAVTGDLDYLLRIVVSDLDAYSRLALDRLLKIEGVTSIKSSFVLETIKQTWSVPISAAPNN